MAKLNSLRNVSKKLGVYIEHESVALDDVKAPIVEEVVKKPIVEEVVKKPIVEETPVTVTTNIAKTNPKISKVRKDRRYKHHTRTETPVEKPVEDIDKKLEAIKELAETALFSANAARTQNALGGIAGGGIGKKDVESIVASSFSPLPVADGSNLYNVANKIKMVPQSSTISGLRVVTNLGSGLIYADASDPTHAHHVIGVTANAGNPVDVVVEGIIEDPSWNFTPGANLFVGLNGMLTETVPPTAAFSKIIGKVISPTKVLFNLWQAPIQLI